MAGGSINIQRLEMREFEPRNKSKGLVPHDFDEYDETDLLSCIQDCGRWPLGRRSVNVQTYDPGLDWYACCRELVRHLRNQDKINQPVFRRLGEWDVMNNHLVPLLLHAKQNPQTTDKQIFNFAKLFTLLTFPPDKELDFDIKASCYKYVQAHKSACLREGVLSSFMGVLIKPLENAMLKQQTEDDIVKVELMLVLFSNLFSLPSQADVQFGAVDYAEAQQLQRNLVSAAIRENLLDTLLYITQNVLDPANKALNLKVLQVWCGILQCRDPRKLAATKINAHEEEKSKREALAAQRARVQAHAERRRRERAKQLLAGSRHGRWGGALKVTAGGFGGAATILGGSNIKDALYEKPPPKIAPVDKFRRGNTAAPIESAASRRQDAELRAILMKLMGCGCNELIKSTRETIFGNTSNAALRLTQDEAESWMTFVEFTVAFHLCCESLRIEEEQQKLTVDKANTSAGAFDVAPIADAVTPPAFHTVLKMCDTLMEEKHWAALTRCAGALHQMMAGVQRLCSDTSYEKNRNIGKQIYLHIFSEMTYLKIFPALVKVYDGKKHFRELLISAVSTADIVLRLLEEVATEGFVTTRKMKVTRKVARPDQPDGTLAAQMEPEKIVERREKVVELDFVDHVKKEYAASHIVRQYCELLKDYQTNPAHVTEHVISFLELLTERCQMGAMLYQLSVFCLFSEVLNNSSKFPNKDRLTHLCNLVLTDFFKEVERDRGILGRVLFWSRKGDIKSLTLEKKKTAKVTNNQVGGNGAADSDEEKAADSDDDGDMLTAVSRRLGRYTKRAQVWRKDDVDALVLQYGKWQGLDDAGRAELIARNLPGDRTGEQVQKQILKLKLNKTTRAGRRAAPKKLAVGEDPEAVAAAGLLPLLVDVEKCLGRLRKSLSEVTTSATAFASGCDWAANLMRDAHKEKAPDADYVIVPLIRVDWQMLEYKWLQQLLLIVGLSAPNKSAGMLFWRIPHAVDSERLLELAELIQRVVKQGDTFAADEDDEQQQRLAAETAAMEKEMEKEMAVEEEAMSSSDEDSGGTRTERPPRGGHSRPATEETGSRPSYNSDDDDAGDLLAIGNGGRESTASEDYRSVSVMDAEEATPVMVHRRSNPEGTATGTSGSDSPVTNPLQSAGVGEDDDSDGEAGIEQMRSFLGRREELAHNPVAAAAARAAAAAATRRSGGKKRRAEIVTETAKKGKIRSEESDEDERAAAEDAAAELRTAREESESERTAAPSSCHPTASIADNDDDLDLGLDSDELDDDAEPVPPNGAATTVATTATHMSEQPRRGRTAMLVSSDEDDSGED